MRIIAYYLPQFHDIPENDEWWGKGFTEWTNIKKAKPQFEGHQQPKVPLNNNYYNLLDNDVKRWQVEIAKEYGVYGFCYYHYWFNGKLLLEKPMEQMLADKTIDFPFCISWANHSWSKTWVGDRKTTLIKQEYGDEKEWVDHFNYLLQFFKDERYIKENGKPLLVLYQPEVIPCLNEMLDLWESLAKNAGFPGLCLAFQTITTDFIKEADDPRFTYCIEYQPRQGRVRLTDRNLGWIKRARRKIARIIRRATGIDILQLGTASLQKIAHTNRIDYDDVWNSICSMRPLSNKSVPGAFSMWDNSPRYGEKAEIYIGSSPEKFEHYMTRQIEHCKKDYGTDIIFFFAWNEWCEGGYLEPDTDNGFAYLEGIRNALINNQEWPTDYLSDRHT